MTDLRSFAKDEMEDTKQDTIICMKELVDGEYECYDWSECETKYSTTYIVKIRKTGVTESGKLKIQANSNLTKIIDNIGIDICQFITNIKVDLLQKTEQIKQ